MAPKRLLYSPSKVKSALSAIRSGMSVNKASVSFKVPRTTLRHKIAGTAPETSGKFGPKPQLGDVEKALTNWIIECAKVGMPINKEFLFDSVEHFVKKEGLSVTFTNGRPGRKWFDSFRRRNPEVRQKHAEYLSKSRADITESTIRQWFDATKSLLGNNCEILKDPRRVFNTDETAFTLTPSKGLVLVPRGESVYYDVSKHSDKVNITTLITVNADGLFAKPMTVYNYQRTPAAILDNAPKEWVIGNTQQGWMTGECFYEWVCNQFHPWLLANDIPLPIILFMDGHRSHLSLHLATFCRENGIILVTLPPNTTHLMQPLDVAVFRSMKARWKTLLRHWRFRNNGEEVTKATVTVALKELLMTNEYQSIIKSGFRACGLYPLDPNAVDYRKIVAPAAKKPDSVELVNVEPMTHLKYIESKIEPKLRAEFEETYKKGLPWDGEITAGLLYDVWLETKLDSNLLQSRVDVTVERTLINEDGTANSPTSNINPHSVLNVRENISGRFGGSHNGRQSEEGDHSHISSSTPVHSSPAGQPAVSNDLVASTSPFGIAEKRKLATSMEEIFNDSVIWPEKERGKKKVTKAFNPPVTVVTSDEWIAWKQLREKEKEEKEAEKIAKKMARLQKIEQKKSKENLRNVKKIVSIPSSTDCSDMSELDGDDSLDGVDPFNASSGSESDSEEIFFGGIAEPQVNDFVLVEFKRSKGGNIYYVGQVTALEDENDVWVNFMRKGIRDFSFPVVPDHSIVKKEAVKKVLPKPTTRRGKFTFASVRFPRTITVS